MVKEYRMLELVKIILLGTEKTTAGSMLCNYICIRHLLQIIS